MATISTLAVNLIARTSVFERGIKRSRKSLRGFKTDTASATAGIARFAKRLLIGGGAVLALKAFTNAASRAQETMNLFNTVFAENAKETSRWADSFAKNVGRSRTEVRELAASLQDTFVPLGFARDRAAELSKTLVELGVDIASFKNIASDREVVDALTSAIVGNHRAVRRFGIVITEGEIKLEALRAGITKNFQELTSLEKVQLRYNIILRSSTDAQGDAIKTAGNYANRVKKLKGQWVDLQEKLGKQILPTMTRLLDNLIKNKDAIVSTVKNIVIFSAKAILMVGAINLVIKTVVLLVKAFKALAIARTIVLSLSGPAGWALIAAGAAIAAGAIISLNEVIDGTIKKLKVLGQEEPEVKFPRTIKSLKRSIALFKKDIEALKKADPARDFFELNPIMLANSQRLLKSRQAELAILIKQKNAQGDIAIAASKGIADQEKKILRLNEFIERQKKKTLSLFPESDALKNARKGLESLSLFPESSFRKQTEQAEQFISKLKQQLATVRELNAKSGESGGSPLETRIEKQILEARDHIKALREQVGLDTFARLQIKGLEDLLKKEQSRLDLLEKQTSQQIALAAAEKKRLAGALTLMGRVKAEGANIKKALEDAISGDKVKSIFDLAKQAKKLKEALKSPADKLKEMKNTLSDMFKRGLINAAEFAKGLAAAREGLFPGDSDRGGGRFQEVRSAFIDVAALNPAQTPTTELVKLNEKTETSNQLLRELNLNARGLHTA